MAKTEPSRSEAEYKAALARVEEVWDARRGAPEFDELEALATLVEAYEDEHYPIGHPTAAGAIEFRMDQEGLTPEDMPDLGTPSEIRGVLMGERPVTPKMAAVLREQIGIPYDVLLHERRAAPAAGANR